MPLELLVRYSCVPVRREGERIVLAFGALDDPTTVDELEFLLERPIEPVLAPPERVAALLRRHRGGEILLEQASEGLRLQLLGDDETATVEEKLLPAESPIVRLVDSLVLGAIDRRASDIHIETKDREVLAKYRIDGVLYPALEPLDKRHHDTIISRLKVMSELDIAEKRVPQDGRFRLRVKGRTIDFRVSIMPSIHGEDAVIRILDKEQLHAAFRSLRLDVLGFSEADLRKLRKYITEPYGMVLVTGPTGSGKTTTLYAALSEIASPEDKIITIEDPVEYQIPGIVQVPVNEKKGLTFARGLRSILRHDPDKIMVGEVRDPETAQIAVQSALTGHLVFTTVHANNVFDVIGRFIHMGVEPYNFVSALNCVMAQRLVRVLCTSCKRKAQPPEAAAARVGPRPRPLPRPGLLRDGRVRGVRRHRLPRPDRGGGAPRHVRPHPPDDPGATAGGRDEAGGARGGHDLPPRLRPREGVRRRHHPPRDQQGHLRAVSDEKAGTGAHTEATRDPGQPLGTGGPRDGAPRRPLPHLPGAPVGAGAPGGDRADPLRRRRGARTRARVPPRPRPGRERRGRSPATASSSAAEPERWPISLSVVRHVAESGLAVLASDIRGDASFKGAASVHRFRIRSVLAVPLGPRPVRGVLYLDTQAAERAFSAGGPRLRDRARRPRRARPRPGGGARPHGGGPRPQRRAARAAAGGAAAPRDRGARPRRSSRPTTRCGASPGPARGCCCAARRAPARSSSPAPTRPRAARPARGWVPVPIPALAPTLVESELFGHVRGAFTEATRDKKGRLEMADQGVLFLDEIGDVEPALQTKLLRFLDSGELFRVGDTAARRVDALVVSATNRPLEKDVEAGRFRADLLARLGHDDRDPAAARAPRTTSRCSSSTCSRALDRGPSRHRFVPEALGAPPAPPLAVQRARAAAGGRARGLPGGRRGGAAGAPAGLPAPGGRRQPPPLRRAARRARCARWSRRPRRAHVLRTLEHTGGNKRRAIELLGHLAGDLLPAARGLGPPPARRRPGVARGRSPVRSSNGRFDRRTPCGAPGD